jgi:hypothetical protein
MKCKPLLIPISVAVLFAAAISTRPTLGFAMGYGTSGSPEWQSNLSITPGRVLRLSLVDERCPSTTQRPHTHGPASPSSATHQTDDCAAIAVPVTL